MYKKNLLALLFCFLLVLTIDIFTNDIDIVKYDWDFRHYIALAKYGFKAFPLLSPFSYRFGTPFMVSFIHDISGLSIYAGFKIIAYLGIMIQLFGLYLLVKYISSSEKSAYMAILITALSIANVKALLFDVFRSDHLAYGIILLQTYTCMKRRYMLLLFLTLVGLQYREFTIIPLLAYIVCSIKFDFKKTIEFKYVLMTVLCIVVGIVIPRILIKVTASVQFVDFSYSGMKKILTVPFDLKRDFNFVFATVANILPLLMLSSIRNLREAFLSFEKETRWFLSTYIFFVMLLSIYGGTDLVRFVSYLFIAQAILMAKIIDKSNYIQITITLFAMMIFNKTLSMVPMCDYEKYIDFYGGYDSRININTFYRTIELSIFLGVGFFMRKFTFKVRSNTT
jgi:hypothetical protein